MLKEVPVGMYDGKEYLEGIVDLLFEEEGDWVLADYKTDFLPEAGPADLVERYRPQMEAYAQVLAKVGTLVKESGLWFSSSGNLIRFP